MGRAFLRALVLAGTAAATALSPALAGAASPSPTVAPVTSEPPGPTTAGVAWLDGPLPRDAAPGSTITVAAILVQGDGADLMQYVTPAFRLSPATGGGPATVANGTPDWRGHFVAHLEVPSGGVGELGIGLPGTICVNDSCTTGDWPFEIRIGPPVGLPLPLVTTAALVLADSTVAARAQAAVEVDLAARVDWPEPLALPSQLILEVRVAQGPTVAEVALDRDAARLGHYAGNLSLEEPGDYVVQVAVTKEPTEGDLFGTAIRRLTVVAAADPPPTLATASGLPDWWPLGLAAIALVLAAVLILRGRSAETPRR
jgi:hypothetical protein